MKEGWEIKKLGDICCKKQQIERAAKKHSPSDSIVYIDISAIDSSTNNVKEPTTLSFQDAPSRAQQVVKKDDILVSLVRPNLRNIAQINDDRNNLVASSGFCVLRTKENSRYLKYVVLGKQFTDYLISRTSGANYPAVREDDIKEYSIPVPSIAEQEKIVAELDCLSGIIEKKKQQLKEYDALAQSIFYEMFGEDEGKNNGWTTCQVGDVYKFQYGKGNKIPENKGEYPCYGSNGQVGFHVEYNAEDSPIIGHIGAYAGIVIWASGKHYVTYNGVICNLINKDFDPIYAYHMLKSQNYMEKARGGAAQPFVSYDVLREPIIYVPPLALQQEFASKIEAIEKQKELIKKSIEEVETLFNSRMDEYFN